MVDQSANTHSSASMSTLISYVYETPCLSTPMIEQPLENYQTASENVTLALP